MQRTLRRIAAGLICTMLLGSGAAGFEERDGGIFTRLDNKLTDTIKNIDEKDGGIDEAGAQDVSVRGADGAIIVEGLGQDATVNVYNTSGQLVYSGNDSVINTVSGVYVIEISGKVYKTVVR